jgi:hypothetical protein
MPTQKQVGTCKMVLLNNKDHFFDAFHGPTRKKAANCLFVICQPQKLRQRRAGAAWLFLGELG